MTLILSALTHSYVVQVSDRQLSLGGKRIDPPTNKSVIFCGHIAYGYTGQAFIENKATELWLVDVLAGAQSPTQALEAIASELQTPLGVVANSGTNDMRLWESALEAYRISFNHSRVSGLCGGVQVAEQDVWE